MKQEIKPEFEISGLNYMFNPKKSYSQQKPVSQLRIEERQQEIKRELCNQGIYWPSVVPEYKNVRC